MTATAPPQCDSVSPYGSRCEKEAGHDDYHWTVTDREVEAWWRTRWRTKTSPTDEKDGLL